MRAVTGRTHVELPSTPGRPANWPPRQPREWTSPIQPPTPEAAPSAKTRPAKPKTPPAQKPANSPTADRPSKPRRGYARGDAHHQRITAMNKLQTVADEVRDVWSSTERTVDLAARLGMTKSAFLRAGARLGLPPRPRPAAKSKQKGLS